MKNKPSTDRTGDDSWQLGEYQIVEGLSADETAINAGSQALMSGAQLTPPHAGCLLDLGSLLCYKGLDQLALFYLDKAADAVPSSRDVWSLRGWASIGSGSRGQAIESFRKSVSLPGATEGDKKTLEDLEAGRRRMAVDLQKMVGGVDSLVQAAPVEHLLGHPGRTAR